MQDEQPEARHIGSNIYIWANNLHVGENYYATVEDMREGVPCEEGDALFRVRLLPLGLEPTYWKRVWWDEAKRDDTIYAAGQAPETSSDGDYVVAKYEHAGTYPSKVMEGEAGTWYYVDWMWRKAIEPTITWEPYPVLIKGEQLYRKLVQAPEVPYTPWGNEGVDRGDFACCVKLTPFRYDDEVEGHPLHPWRVRVDAEVVVEGGLYNIYVTEHYFVEP